MVLSEPLTETPSETPNWNPLLNLGPWASLFPKAYPSCKNCIGAACRPACLQPLAPKTHGFPRTWSRIPPGPCRFCRIWVNARPENWPSSNRDLDWAPKSCSSVTGWLYFQPYTWIRWWMIVQPWDDDCQGLFQMGWNNQSILELFILPFLSAYTVYHIVQYIWAWVKV